MGDVGKCRWGALEEASWGSSRAEAGMDCRLCSKKIKNIILPLYWKVQAPLINTTPT